jgi:hypothetical protein
VNNVKPHSGYLEQLKQLTTLTYCGDLISKLYTEQLVKNGCAVSVGAHEYYVITDLGVRTLELIGVIRV